MTKSSPPPIQRAFTLIEVVVVIAIMFILAALLVAGVNVVRETAKITKDLNNLRQIGLGLQTYLNDKDNVIPVINAVPGTGTNASPVIYPKYIATRKIFQSPFDRRAASETDTAPVSYGINQNIYDLVGANLGRVVSPSSTILMAPNYSGDPSLSTSWTGVANAVPNLAVGGGAGMTTGTHRNGTQINALFCDLHVQTMPFGSATTPGTFKDFTSDPLGLKLWNPTK